MSRHDAAEGGGGATAPLADITRLLRDHARTFALTLGLLPRPLREPLGIAYLLARATDTIADASGIPSERRLALLEELDDLLEKGDSRSWCPVIREGALSSPEAELIRSLPALHSLLEVLPDRDSILFLWRTILQGQLFDLRRFAPGAGAGAAPLTAGELEFYCGTVAGIVGVFWTGLIAGHAPRTLLRPRQEMEQLGMEYGKGLQLVNILRDRNADRLLGRCYVGDADLPELFDRADEWLRSGRLYLAGLRPGRILMATALPLDLAAPTLDAVRRAPGEQRARIPRGAVRRILLRGAVSLWLPRSADPAS